MQIQERGKDYFVIETSQWVAAISDGLCIARYVYGRYGETRVEIDTNHEGSTSDIKNRNEFLGASDVEVTLGRQERDRTFGPMRGTFGKVYSRDDLRLPESRGVRVQTTSAWCTK